MKRIAAKRHWLEKLCWLPEATLGLANKMLLTWLEGVSDLSWFHILAFKYLISFEMYKICCCVSSAGVILACRDMDRANKATERGAVFLIFYYTSRDFIELFFLWLRFSV